MNHTGDDPTTTPQELADAAEAAAVARYQAMREVWGPCWGTRPAPRRPRSSRASDRRAT